jgi:hypothetical protein
MSKTPIKADFNFEQELWNKHKDSINNDEPNN